MDLFDWYYRQVVSPGELSAAFEAVDNALRTMVTTLGIHGLAVGGDVVPATPTPGLSAVVKGPVLAYDDDGNRIYIPGANSPVDLSLDENGAATAILTPGQERYLGIFARFTRTLSDPRTDGDGNEIMFARLEGTELLVAAGAPAPVGAASRAALRDGHVLLADVRITTGQTQVSGAHILTDRTQYLFRASSGALNIWGRTFPEIVQRILDRFAQFMADASQQFLVFGQQSQETYNTFVTTVNNALATMIKKASDLPFGPVAGFSATNTEAAIIEVKNSVPGAQTAAQTSFAATPDLNADDVQEAIEELPQMLRNQDNIWAGLQTFENVKLKIAWMDNWLRIRGDILYVNNINVATPKIVRVGIPLNLFVPSGANAARWTRQQDHWIVEGAMSAGQVAAGTFTYCPPYNASVRRFLLVDAGPDGTELSASMRWTACDYLPAYDNGQAHGGYPLAGQFTPPGFPPIRHRLTSDLFEQTLFQISQQWASDSSQGAYLNETGLLPNQPSNVMYSVLLGAPTGFVLYGMMAELSIPGPT